MFIVYIDLGLHGLTYVLMALLLHIDYNLLLYKLQSDI